MPAIKRFAGMARSYVYPSKSFSVQIQLRFIGFSN